MEHLELAEGTAQPDQRRQALFNLSLVHAHMGREEEARAEAEELRFAAEEAGEQWGDSNAEAVLGLLELSLGNPADAARHLARTVEIREGIGTTEPIRAYAVTAVKRGASALEGLHDRVLTPLIGRGRELRALEDVFQRAVGGQSDG